jgi:hypothetical protein
MLMSLKSVFETAGLPAMLTFSAFGKWLNLLVALLVFALGIVFIVSIYKSPPLTQLFDFFRASHLWNGVSALHPLLFVGFAALCMAVSDLRRLNLLQECRIKPPFLAFDKGAPASFMAIGKCEEEIANRLEWPFHRLPLAKAIEALVLIAGVYFIVIRQWHRGPTGGGWVEMFINALSNPLDGASFGWFFVALFISVYLLFARSLIRFASVWWSLRKLLRTLYWHPTRTGYEELRQKTVPERGEAQHITFFEPRPSFTAMEGSLALARELLQSANLTRAQLSEHSSVPQPFQDHSRIPSEELPSPYTLASALASMRAVLGYRVWDAEANLTLALKSEADGSPTHAINARRRTQAALARLSAVVLSIFEPFWRSFLWPSLALPDDKEKELVDLGRLFVAARVVDFLRQVFPQLLNLAVFSMVGALAMTLAVSGYPFPNRDTLLWFSWLILLSAAGTILIVFIQMNRDRVLSMLTGTTPGRLNWNSSFVLQLLLFGVIPILTLLGAQFPHTLSGMVSWVGGVFGGGK